MSFEETNRPADHASEEEYREHAEFGAGRSPSGIGVAVTRSEFRDDRRVWECLVTDGNERHHVEVIGVDLGSFPSLPDEEVERAVQDFAATLPSEYRLSALVNATPLRIDRNGHVSG
jgi:hypothetical protein